MTSADSLNDSPEDPSPEKHSPEAVAQEAESPADRPEGTSQRLPERIVALVPISLVSGLTALWALSPAVAVRVEGSAVLLHPDSRVGFYARSAGQVQRLRRQVGDPVRQGEELVSLSRSDQAAAGGGAVGSNPDALVLQLRALADQERAIRSQITNLNTADGPVRQQLASLEELRQEEIIPRYSPLWVGAQDLHLRNRNQIRALEAQLAQLDASRAELRGQRDSQEVLAPRSGRLLSVAVSPGQAVLPGQRLGTIGDGPLQSSSPRLATALFSDADAGRLRVGDEILLDPLLQSRDRYGGTAERYGSLVGRITTISPATADLAEVSRVVGDGELAQSLMLRSRQAAVGEGGDPVDLADDRLAAPVQLVTVALEPDRTPSGLRWTGGPGPDLPLVNGTPARAKVEVERRSAVSFVLPFLRWLGGAER
ncbi:MAG: HlyD family efflux transporter periplasmic adaptor subunit [Prochlorococcaceae cyanobacterium]|jgi:multidrug efflux pump subunit AcrA (membrane-fusion protein)